MLTERCFSMSARPCTSSAILREALYSTYQPCAGTAVSSRRLRIASSLISSSSSSSSHRVQLPRQRLRCLSNAFHTTATAETRRSTVLAAATNTDSDSAATAEGNHDSVQQQQQQQDEAEAQHTGSQTGSFQQLRTEIDPDHDSQNDKDESDSDNDTEDALLSELRGMMPSEQQQAVLADQISARSYESAIQDLGATMLEAGFKGCLALGLGWLLHIEVLANFRWNASDLEQGLLWALPAAAMAAAFTALPLPGQQQQPLAAAAAVAAGSSGCSSSVEEQRSEATYEAVKSMARNSMLAKDIPIEVAVNLDGGDAPIADAAERTRRPVTEFNAGTVAKTLALLQEGFNRPWIIDLAPTQARVLRVIEEQLKRISSEVLWRGLVATALAGIINTSWATAGTSQDSPFFYARLFGLLTPQTSLAAAAAILLLGRLPYLLIASRPLWLYTRLSGLDVKLVGQLTGEDWMVRVAPIAAASSSSQDGSSSSSGSGRDRVFGKLRQQQQQQQQREDAAAEDAGSSSSSKLVDRLIGSSSSSTADQIPKVPVITQQDLDQQFEKLLLSVALYCSSSSSSSSSSSNGGMADQLTAEVEQQGTELIAELLEITKLSAAVKAAAAAAAAKSGSSSSRQVRNAGILSNKIATAFKSVMAVMNSSRQQRYFVIRLGDDDDDEDVVTIGSNLDGSDSKSDSHDDVADLISNASPAARAAARRAAAAVRAGGTSDRSKSVQERLSTALHEITPADLSKMTEDDRMAILGTILKEVMKTSSYAQVMAQGWRAAAVVPTAEDQIARYLLGIYAVLTELAPAGAFVSTGGNVAASVVASCCYNVLAVVVNDAASKRQRDAVQKGLGKDWLLRLLPLQGKD